MLADYVVDYTFVQNMWVPLFIYLAIAIVALYIEGILKCTALNRQNQSSFVRSSLIACLS